MKRMETFPPIPGLLVHHESDCEAVAQWRRAHYVEEYIIYCVIHAPSKHSMNGFPYHWRSDRGLMERICPHGVGHPDPDDIAHKRRVKGDEYAHAESVHGCDGCCAGAYDTHLGPLGGPYRKEIEP